MEIPLYQVDAFTSEVFSGNPAAVCLLQEWLPEGVMQSIAAENNLSETAFLVPEGEAFTIRWFTPKAEIDLCGHATLAAAHVLLSRYQKEKKNVRFISKSGPLRVHRESDVYYLDFPSRPPTEDSVEETLLHSLNIAPQEVLSSRDYLAIFESQQQVEALRPDMQKLSQISRLGLIVTSPGVKADFVSRFFCPKLNVPEDPVTGSAHCTLIPYWSKRLGKDILVAEQLSERGGKLWCKYKKERVEIGGKAVDYLEGTIHI